MQATTYIIPALFIFILCLSIVKKQNAYQTFVEGATGAINLMAKVFPYLLAVMIAVEIFRQTGISAKIAHFVAPAFNLVGIPSELAELVLIRPLSGAGAMAILDNIYQTYGTDTLIGKTASMIYGSSETIFYISTIYFTQSKVRNLRYAIPVAIIATLVGVIVGAWMIRMQG
ncbi:MAG: spore maturation protein [Firmicutes bacterium]|nr:spore maturation protein [Bacillota bacterium]MCL1953694.1 spore maturation protein [Bacillota bacterium]